MKQPTSTHDLQDLCRASIAAIEQFCQHVHKHLQESLCPQGKLDPQRFDEQQKLSHGYAWLMTTVEALKHIETWASKLSAANQFSPSDRAIVQLIFAEYLAQIRHSLMMSPQEFVRPDMFTQNPQHLALLDCEAITTLIAYGQDSSAEGPARLLVKALQQQQWSNNGDAISTDPETYAMIREQFHRFTEEAIVPHAQAWHQDDALIPLDVIQQMSELGVFSIAIPEAYGGLGMSKRAMCLVTEELSRGFLAAGSLGTRSEIAAELIRLGGREEQKQHWLPRIADGSILPCAVFTEPNTGSDLGSLTTRAVRKGDHYHIHGAKTWITHGARSDVMTLLARTDPEQKGYRGLSMFLAEKPRGDDKNPFPAKGMAGSEIHVLGYRGMKEYEISFDDFVIPASSLLGDEEGQGFKQLMATFESARIQTAARAVGVAQACLETALSYASERKQFGKAIIDFPRIHDKIALMAAEIQAVRQLTYHAAVAKDSDERCDIVAGMAKLLSARVAWSCADNALQVHGGNGYALEYNVSRLLCDARILSIFEGAAEIQAHVIARGLLR